MSDVALKIEKVRRKARANGFKWFVNNVFPSSFEKNEFIKGNYIDSVCDNMENNSWTMDVSARDHFKSTRLYAEIMFDIFTTKTDIEAWYFSYGEALSSYHIKKVKDMIRRNFFFRDIIDLKKQSDGVLGYITATGARYTCDPSGLLTFKRGIHADRIYIDDPLKDPENKLAPVAIVKINRVVKTEMYPMVNKGGICRVVGTPQTNTDFFFDEDLQNQFKVFIRPAIIDEANGIALFPEWHPFDELINIRKTIGEKPFNQEYLCKPSYSENSYIDRKDLMNIVNKDLKEVAEYKGEGDVVAGFDIGKKAHPAHFAIYSRTRNEQGKYHYTQLLTKWFDHVEYRTQLEFCLYAIEAYGIDKLRYDNTRGEFEGFKEQGLIPRQMEGVVFSVKTNNGMAVSFSTIITEERIEMINDVRQVDQILQVNNDLQAVESPMGHGDSFWSNALALWEERENRYGVRS